jgi:hypothetical protein
MKHKMLVAVIIISFWGVASPTFAGDRGLGKKIAGTYVGVQTGDAQVLQISPNGNLRFLFSIQFDTSGAANLPFSNSWGSWKQTGQRQITANVTNMSFGQGDGAFAGVSAAAYTITFGNWFRTANVTCEGAIFPPGVNPFRDQDADPIQDGEFTCDFDVHRISVVGEEGHPKHDE